MTRLLVAVAVGACVFAPAATATAPQLKYPHHIAFGSATVGSVGEQFVTLTNRGKTPLTVFSIGVSSTTGSYVLDFANDGCVGTTLDPGASCTYGIRYTPVVRGRQIGTSDIGWGTSGLTFIKLSGHAK
jgi:Abnormal spindle-like microcephaly-assoc'd, ASPM-SPD-2-Hydin